MVRSSKERYTEETSEGVKTDITGVLIRTEKTL